MKNLIRTVLEKNDIVVHQYVKPNYDKAELKRRKTCRGRENSPDFADKDTTSSLNSVLERENTSSSDDNAVRGRYILRRQILSSSSENRSNDNLNLSNLLEQNNSNTQNNFGSPNSMVGVPSPSRSIESPVRKRGRRPPPEDFNTGGERSSLRERRQRTLRRENSFIYY